MSYHEQALRFIASNPDMCREIAAILSKPSASEIKHRVGMTAKQRDLYKFIGDYALANEGVAPSFDEMKDAMGLRSKSGVHRLVSALEERGLIHRFHHRARAIGLAGNSEIVRQEPAVTAATPDNLGNERCRDPKGCQFSHHPLKVTCAACTSAWAKRRKKGRSPILPAEIVSQSLRHPPGAETGA